jgi:hypothetical protein
MYPVEGFVRDSNYTLVAVQMQYRLAALGAF